MTRLLAAVVGVALLVAGLRVDTALRRDLRHAREELAAAGARMVGAEAARLATEAAADEAEADAAEARDRTAEALATAADRADEREELFAAAAAVEAQAAGVERTLAGRREDAGEQATAVADLQACVRGVAEAVSRSQRDDTAGSVAALQAVAGACRDAEDALGTPEEANAFPFDFADPFVLHVADAYYAYATNAGGGTVQAIASEDLREWWWLGDALPDLPGWASPNATWAPSVLVRGDRVVAYYTVRVAASGHQCISVAVADHPAGPFVDVSDEPFVCQAGRRGSIDPSPFLDADGRPWLVWKSESPAAIWSQRLTDDGLGLTGEPTQLLAVDRPWEGSVVEGPSMVEVDGAYHLFYSGNDWNSAAYAVGWAACDGPAGPCRKGDGPVLASGGGLAGPGGQELFRDGDGRLRMAYHAWLASDVGYPNRRLLQLATVRFEDGRPVVEQG
ncbi:MAG TPA: glycoside hydrolase family 43 protein [Acidimicrobiales bacterium]